MRNILKSRLGRASIVAAIAGLAILSAGSSVEARDGYWDHWGRFHYAPYRYGHWWHTPAYGYRFYGWSVPYYRTYYAPPVYYGPPAATFSFNVPLG